MTDSSADPAPETAAGPLEEDGGPLDGASAAISEAASIAEVAHVDLDEARDAVPSEPELVGAGVGVVAEGARSGGPRRTASRGGDRLQEEDYGRRIVNGDNLPHRIQAYDFYRQESVDRSRLRVLEPILDTLTHRLAGATSAVVRQGVKVAIGELEQLGWEDYATSQPDPTCISTALISPFDCRLLAHLPVSLAMRILDFNLGGDGTSIPTRDVLTDIERALVGPMLSEWWEGFCAVFSSALELRLTHVQQSTSMLLVPIGRPGETCLVIELNFEINDVAVESAQICVPLTAVMPLIEQIEAQQSNPTVQLDAMETRMRLQVVPVEIKASYPPIALTTTELLNLRPGDVVTVREGPPEENVHVNLVAGEVFVGTGTLVELGGKLGCAVTSKREDLT